MGTGPRTVSVAFPDGSTHELRLTFGDAMKYKKATKGKFTARKEGVSVFSGDLAAVADEYDEADWLVLFEHMMRHEGDDAPTAADLEDLVDVDTFLALTAAVGELTGGALKEVGADPEDPTASET